jgi:hypothetical protein
MAHEVTIQNSFPDEMRSSAAQLYGAAFEAKLSITIPNRVSRIAGLEKGFHPSFSFVALSGEDLVGIAGFKTEQGALKIMHNSQYHRPFEIHGKLRPEIIAILKDPGSAIDGGNP